jgi:mannose-1-phosphate guanylyltransferase
MQRALAVAPLQRVCTVVAAQHCRWWQRMLSCLPEQNVIAQPHNRGTAHGILLPLLRIAAQDPDAVVMFLPSDHYIDAEAIFAASLRQAATLATLDRDSIYLLGIEPEQADPELGYIVPASRSRGEPAAVLRFVEKPSAELALQLLEQGGLWNVFVMAASVRALLTLFEETLPAAVAAMQRLSGPAVENLYRQLPSVDFSRDILEGREDRLQVLSVPRCGWTDLGTPPRVASTLQRLEEVRVGPALRTNPSVHLNLAAQYESLQHQGPRDAALMR